MDLVRNVPRTKRLKLTVEFAQTMDHTKQDGSSDELNSTSYVCDEYQ